MEYPIPARAAAARASHAGKRLQNPGLIFDRFAPDWMGTDTAKKQGLSDVKTAAAAADNELLREWNVRWESVARSAGAGPDAIFSLRTEWRLIAGLGRKGPLEVGFTFHRYGFPILPGSGVKGLARAYASLIEGMTASDADFLAIFGRAAEKPGEESSAGLAVFFDAIPRRLPILDLDIMNPHYPAYYQGRSAPDDGQNPIPVYFLTVASSTEFRFAVGWRTPSPLDAEAQRLQKLAVSWLVGGLTQLGAGAKTSAGYGYFAEPVILPEKDKDKLPPPVRPTQESRGKVRYERRRAWIVDEQDNQHHAVDFKTLQMDQLKEKTIVEYVYEIDAQGKRKIVRVTKVKA